MFKPDPKVKKKRSPTYKCSDGTRVTQSQIQTRLSNVYKIMEIQHNCTAYPNLQANDHDHTISQARCKQLHKTELIWDINNIEFSSRLAHNEWESYKSGEFEEHENCYSRMIFTKKHDQERFEKRMQNLSDYQLIKRLRE